MGLLGIYKNGNTINKIFSDGTRICETEDNEFRFDFARNMDIKICDRCSMACKFCHEGSTPNGKLGDILNEKFIDTLHPYQVVAIGGGNVLEHPDLIPFLEKLKGLKVITNITLNQIHFEQNIELVDMLFREKLIYGLGVSLVKPTKEFIEKVKKYPNVVIHVINGIVSLTELRKLANNNLKILILGYKEVRKGKILLANSAQNTIINNNKEALYAFLPKIITERWFDVVSFDNLSIKQLNPKGRFVSDEDWETIYMGDDGLDGEQTSASMYIDLVENEFARNSCDVDHRMPVGNMSVKEMYKILCKM